MVTAAHSTNGMKSMLMCFFQMKWCWDGEICPAPFTRRAPQNSKNTKGGLEELLRRAVLEIFNLMFCKFLYLLSANEWALVLKNSKHVRNHDMGLWHVSMTLFMSYCPFQGRETDVQLEHLITKEPKISWTVFSVCSRNFLTHTFEFFTN